MYGAVDGYEVEYSSLGDIGISKAKQPSEKTAIRALCTRRRRQPGPLRGPSNIPATSFCGGAWDSQHALRKCHQDIESSIAPYLWQISTLQLANHLQLYVFIQCCRNVVLAFRLPSLVCRKPLFTSILAPPPLRPRSRLSLISRHLDHRPLLPINTPFSTERQASEADDILYTAPQRETPKSQEKAKRVKMSHQAEHPALLIPGPIEFDDAVLDSMSHFGSVMPLSAHFTTH